MQHLMMGHTYRVEYGPNSLLLVFERDGTITIRRDDTVVTLDVGRLLAEAEVVQDVRNRDAVADEAAEE